MTEIIQAIKQFLAEHRASDGGYAEVKAEDMRRLHELIALLLDEKFERDSDGDFPVDVTIIDRTRYRGSHYQALLREDDSTHNARRALTNLELATWDMRRVVEDLGVT